MGEALKTFGVVVSLAIIFFYSCVPQHSGSRHRARRINCAGNLKQIGLALRMYSSDNDEHFPPDLYRLVETNYLTHPKVYLCPSCSLPEGLPQQFETRADFITDYHYFPGYTEETAGMATPLVVEKLGNHTRFGNVCFGDGHVKGFAGDEWWKRAGLTQAPPANKRSSRR